MHSVKRNRQRAQEYNRHRFYLKKIKANSVYCPRYDMLSLNNNLLLHRNYDPKAELQPQRQSLALSNLQNQINSKKHSASEQKTQTKVKWFQEVLGKEEPKEGKFPCQYLAVQELHTTVKEQLNKIYHLSRRPHLHTPQTPQSTIYRNLHRMP